MAEQRGGALPGATDTFLFGRRDKIVSLAAQYRIPAIYYLPEFAEAGGLMAYGNRVTEAYRHVGIYVGRILKGEKPADSAGGAGDRVRICYQSQDRKGAGPHHSAGADFFCRRRDRIVRDVRFWHLADMP